MLVGQAMQCVYICVDIVHMLVGQAIQLVIVGLWVSCVGIVVGSSRVYVSACVTLCSK